MVGKGLLKLAVALDSQPSFDFDIDDKRREAHRPSECIPLKNISLSLISGHVAISIGDR